MHTSPFFFIFVWTRTWSIFSGFTSALDSALFYLSVVLAATLPPFSQGHSFFHYSETMTVSLYRRLFQIWTAFIIRKFLLVFNNNWYSWSLNLFFLVLFSGIILNMSSTWYSSETTTWFTLLWANHTQRLQVFWTCHIFPMHFLKYNAQNRCTILE